MYLDTQVFHELNLVVDDIDGQPVSGQLAHVQAAGELLLLEHRHVTVAHPGQEAGARNGGGSAAQQPDLGVVGVRKVSPSGRGKNLQVRLEKSNIFRAQFGLFCAFYLRNLHVLEHLDGELLESPNVDGAFLRSLQVAASDTQIRGRTNLTKNIIKLSINFNRKYEIKTNDLF